MKIVIANVAVKGDIGDKVLRKIGRWQWTWISCIGVASHYPPSSRFYQWYQGDAPDASLPIAGATSASYADDSKQGMYGSYGIVHIEVPGHDGVGVHLGREGVTDGYGNSDWSYATNGCIRTTDDAMKTITDTMKNDPITKVDVTRSDDRHWNP